MHIYLCTIHNCHLKRYLESGMKISDISIDISSIYPISVMFDTISAMTDISYIGFGPIYRENIRSMAHARISLIFR